jgi:predicted outer membrane repeat protein
MLLLLLQADLDGGGLYAEIGNLVTISNSSFVNNSAANFGGGIEVLGQAMTIRDVLFQGNKVSCWLCNHTS